MLGSQPSDAGSNPAGDTKLISESIHIRVMKLFLEGVYSRGEVVWIELKWLFLLLLRHRKYTFMLDSFIPEWVEVIPSAMMMRYSDAMTMGDILYYRFEGTQVVRYRHGVGSRGLPISEDVMTKLRELHDKLAYEEIDNILV